MIFPEHRTIFFHVPRTGGTSVEQLLAGRELDASVLDRERLWGWDPEAGLPGCIDAVRHRLGLTEPLPDVNKTRYPSVRRKPTAAHYDAESIDLVRQAYAEDFTLYGYSDALPGTSAHS